MNKNFNHDGQIRMCEFRTKCFISLLHATGKRMISPTWTDLHHSANYSACSVRISLWDTVGL